MVDTSGRSSSVRPGTPATTGCMPGPRTALAADRPAPALSLSVSLAPVEEKVAVTDGVNTARHPWVTIVLNGPVNLMSYVTYLFQHHFGYPRRKAEKGMIDIHAQGRPVVAAGLGRRWRRTPRRSGYGLWRGSRSDA